MSLAIIKSRFSPLLLAAALALFAPACDSSSDDTSATDESTTDTGDGDAGPCDEAPTPVFLNRSPGSYRPGAVDARNNTTTQIEAETDVVPTTYDDDQWNEFANCVRDALSPFHLEVVETEPTTGAYTEIAVGDTHWDQPVIVALAENSCDLVERPLMFLFTQDAQNSPELMCRFGVAYWATVSVGLDFTNDESDWMNVVSSMSSEWTDAATPCTSLTGTPRPCRCDETSETQNSYGALVDQFGLVCP